MPAHHVVVGAGPVGRATASLLASGGERVLLVSRSGTGPELPGVERVAADVADASRLTRLADGAAALYDAVNPPSYDVWPSWWPPVAESFLLAAERTGAVLATASCLYAYGPVDGPMVEGLPDAAPGVKGRIRAGMWADALAAHRAGRLRAVEVRASDFMGPGVTNAHVPVVVPKALAGRTVRLFGDPSLPHSFTDVRDLARALVVTAATPTAWGRVWHAPTNPARSGVETVADVCRAAGVAPAVVRSWPRAMLTVGGLAVPFLREMRETVYQFERPYVLDSSAAERELGLTPTPWDEVCRATAETAGARVPVAL
ncbi:epimerase [Nocardioides sp. TRM66260-LWL]|uniref:NAD-dependent epimerase/dehydratase family protein n=1 Tax=Nocardioides sp. TRM66260-LWL TaxID=2874478 RepID=UPI001CC39EBC|nr:NAD-dependent epimerase/dehydratase family protein [Nocardioides sp. TRM66260-LWL]MBZ5733703.1 epimerase [Nocardioides sp. TRM66260-LWL]